MKAIRFVPYILVVTLLLSAGCINKVPYGPQTVPYVLFFHITENNSRLPDSILSEVRLSYFRDGKKQYLTDLEIGIDNLVDSGVLCTRDIGLVSADNGIKDYYLEYPGGDVDTIFADYRNVDYEEASKNICGCYMPLEQLTFNGRNADIDKAFQLQRVYSFNK